MDKREIASTFQSRLRRLLERRGDSATAFARRCGLDRSALSQFLDPSIVRLPRSETLAAIAAGEGVSIDWLLGISQDEAGMGEVAPVLSIEAGIHGVEDSPLAEWHRESAGYKIRYAPSSLPDLLRTKAVTDHEFATQQTDYAEVKSGQARQQLDYTRLPETDMEVVLPFQRLENLAQGTDIWSSIPRGVRQAQLMQMAKLLDELYPTFRMFLYDGLQHYCAPFTVFGPIRAAVYIGDMYIVLNSVEHIQQLTRRFDSVIRVACISPDRAADWISDLKVT